MRLFLFSQMSHLSCHTHLNTFKYIYDRGFLFWTIDLLFGPLLVFPFFVDHFLSRRKGILQNNIYKQIQQILTANSHPHIIHNLQTDFGALQITMITPKVAKLDCFRKTAPTDHVAVHSMSSLEDRDTNIMVYGQDTAGTFMMEYKVSLTMKDMGEKIPIPKVNRFSPLKYCKHLLFCKILQHLSFFSVQFLEDVQTFPICSRTVLPHIPSWIFQLLRGSQQTTVYGEFLSDVPTIIF